MSAPEPQVQVRSAVPTFLAADVEATARWYAAHLGFDLAGHVPAAPPYAYASVMRGAAEIMLLSAPDGFVHADPGPLRPTGAWDAYLRVDAGVDALYERLRGAPFVVTPLVDRPYGDREFEVLDPNGYRLVFGGR